MKKRFVHAITVIVVSLLVWGIPKLFNGSDACETYDSSITDDEENPNSPHDHSYEGMRVWEFKKKNLRDQEWELTKYGLNTNQLMDGEIIRRISSQNPQMPLYKAVELCKWMN